MESLITSLLIPTVSTYNQLIIHPQKSMLYIYTSLNKTNITVLNIIIHLIHSGEYSNVSFGLLNLVNDKCMDVISEVNLPNYKPMCIFYANGVRQSVYVINRFNVGDAHAQIRYHLDRL